MIDVDTYLTVLYATVDDFSQLHPPEKKSRPGPEAEIPPLARTYLPYATLTSSTHQHLRSAKFYDTNHTSVPFYGWG